jgi:transposase
MSASACSDPTLPDPSKLVLGIDVSGKQLDLAYSDGHVPNPVAYDDAGLAKLRKQLRDKPAALVVLESTGGIEQRLIDFLLEADIPVTRVEPGRVRHFALAEGKLAKTDPIDAGTIGRFGQRVATRVLQKRSEKRVELDALVTCRRQLVSVRTDQTNRRRNVASKKALAAIDAILASLKEQIAELDKAIRQIIDSDDDLDDLDRILQSTPGVGPGLSATLLGAVSELGTVEKNRVAALIGVAPFNNDSGPRKGVRRIRGGRQDVRDTLYMATVAALRCNAVIQHFAKRLKDAGKPFKVVVTACMRKLLTMLNAMVRDRITWDQLAVVKSLQTA